MSKTSFSRKESFHRKEKPSLSISMTKSQTKSKQHLGLSDLDEGSVLDLGPINVPQMPKPALHLGSRPTAAAAVMGSIASFPGQPIVSQHVSMNAIIGDEDGSSTKSSPRLSEDHALL